jgi:hypothetical protein
VELVVDERHELVERRFVTCVPGAKQDGQVAGRAVARLHRRFRGPKSSKSPAQEESTGDSPPIRHRFGRGKIPQNSAVARFSRRLRLMSGAEAAVRMRLDVHAYQEVLCD